jgi:broad specificity phosphatase PhoE
MKLKYVYFVRHGESVGNVGNLHSHPDQELTETGHKQAAFIAERCSKLPLQALIASTYTRAQQTAHYISEKTGLSIESSDLFVECKFLSKHWAKPSDDPEAQAALQQIFDNWGKPGYRLGDEENFEDVSSRADAALQLLAERPEEHVGVVTHGLFLRNLVARALFGKELTAQQANVFYWSFRTKNTGLTILLHDEAKKPLPWTLWVWNDHAHLAE